MKIKWLLLIVLLTLNVSCASETKVNGEMFVVIKTGESVKLGAVNIKIVEKQHYLKSSQKGVSDILIQADFETITNADGKFEIHLPTGDYFIFAKSSRNIGSKETEIYEWKVPFSVPLNKPLILSNQNITKSK